MLGPVEGLKPIDGLIKNKNVLKRFLYLFENNDQVRKEGVILSLLPLHTNESAKLHALWALVS